MESVSFSYSQPLQVGTKIKKNSKNFEIDIMVLTENDALNSNNLVCLVYTPHK